MAKSPEERESKDLALLQGPTEDGEGAKILRFRDGNVSAGELRPVKEGQPLHSQELLRLRPVEGTPALCEVEVLHEAPKSRQHGGPARIATAAYRRNWNQVFAKAPDSEEPTENDVDEAAPAIESEHSDDTVMPRGTLPRKAKDPLPAFNARLNTKTKGDWSLN